MKKIRVNTGKPYDVTIGSSILSSCADAVTDLGRDYDKIAVISDDVVRVLYGKTVIESFKTAGFPVVEYVFKNGERSKSMTTLNSAAEFLCANFVTRKSLIVALGGGVVGDLAGFAASIYQRGIDYIQVPTTFLAAVDSSVGGKTAVNVPQGKNLLGSFWQPSLVWCDVDTFSTLDKNIFLDGVAETVKYGCILDEDLFARVRDSGFSDGIDEIVARSIEIKAKVVEQDERENGMRALLNFGHTLGHGIEKLSSFTISHGKAVAIGMVLAARAGEAAGLTESGTAAQITGLFKANGVATDCPFPISDVCHASLGDKKRDGDIIKLIMLEKIGKAFIHPVPVDKLAEFFAKTV